MIAIVLIGVIVNWLALTLRLLTIAAIDLMTQRSVKRCAADPGDRYRHAVYKEQDAVMRISDAPHPGARTLNIF